MRWLELGPDEVLLCESDEDAEHYLFNANGAVTQIQFKNRRHARAERQGSGIHSGMTAGRTVRFVFTTSPRRVQQQTTKLEASRSASVVVSKSSRPTTPWLTSEPTASPCYDPVELQQTRGSYCSAPLASSDASIKSPGVSITRG